MTSPDDSPCDTLQAGSGLRVLGIDVIAEVRTLYPSTRVIAMSGGGNFGPFDYQKDSIGS